MGGGQLAAATAARGVGARRLLPEGSVLRRTVRNVA